jgi:hypothetical protein
MSAKERPSETCWFCKHRAARTNTVSTAARADRNTKTNRAIGNNKLARANRAAIAYRANGAGKRLTEFTELTESTMPTELN